MAGWTAPDECTFNTMIDVQADGSAYESPPFDGPISDDDANSYGVLGAAVPTTAPGSNEPVVLVLVAVFTHDAVVTMTMADEVDHGPYSTLDTQPADGWTVLALLVPNDAVPLGETMTVRVASEDAAGQLESTDVEISPIGSDGTLAVHTPEWEFDMTSVGPQCQPPTSTQTSPSSPSTFGVASGPMPWGGSAPTSKPQLPAPGASPEDAPAATADALTAFRTVYDIGNIYDEGKASHLEQPDLGLRIFREIRAARVVEPYLSALGPVFDSVVFVNPTEAAVLYRVGPGYRWEIGRVLLIDSVWRLSLGTLCRDLSAAGYRCPGVDPDPPPGPLG
jgi:hypothetical protein